MQNFKEEFTLSDDNYYLVNPVIPGDVQRKKINGQYVYEKFYLIDFLEIKKDSYVISSFGRVFSLITNLELKCCTNQKRSNYTTVILRSEDGKPRKYQLHRLVARAFVPKTETDILMNRQFVHHTNWDNMYNYYWNLEWRSSTEITIIRKLQEEEVVSTGELVKFVCKLLEEKESVEDIFKILRGLISREKINGIKNKTIYKFVSCDYNF